MRCLAVLSPPLLVLLLPSMATAQCNNYVVRKNVVVKEVVVKEVVLTPVAVAVFTPLYLPTYGSGYYPPPVQQAPQQVPQQQARAAASTEDPVLAELRKLNQRLDALEKRGTGQPPLPGEPDQARAPVQGGAGLRLLASHCGGCHDKSKAATEGKGFVMFDGPNLTLDDRGAVKALRKARRGEMPPADNKYKIPALSDAEFAEVADVLELRK